MLTRCSRDLRYQFVSPTYAEMIGRPPDEIAGRAIVEIMGEEAFETICPYIETVLKGIPVEYQCDLKIANVGIRSLRVVYTPEPMSVARCKGGLRQFSTSASVNRRRTHGHACWRASSRAAQAEDANRANDVPGHRVPRASHAAQRHRGMGGDAGITASPDASHVTRTSVDQSQYPRARTAGGRSPGCLKDDQRQDGSGRCANGFGRRRRCRR